MHCVKRMREKNIIRERIPDMIDCAIVIGGDGSLIEVAKNTLEKRCSDPGYQYGNAWVSYRSRSE